VYINSLKVEGTWEVFCQLCDAIDQSYISVGGAAKRRVTKKKATKKKAVAKWVSMRRKVTTKKGDVRTLYRNSSTGELRVKRMSTRGGKRVAAYVKP
jgi:hypothetical protein